ncbi:branched-chain amino acid ABC transporter permease/ATP-binding protein [Trebonia sp.]|uniref:branched-chain amino acid ABC transporter permease/ATP-binding protein n=1 Tax=Trebonia sp. TaxID=2767075 RepID=UPI002631F014|nr:branched-chain amino acid ABC transporter permease/ATP-binding protein [Trebonia sp.]
MSVILPYIILGLTSGSVYGMAGVGLVVTYKTSGVFNFAFGAVGTLAAYVFYILNVEHGVPWPVAGLAAVVLLGFVLGVGFEILARELARQALAIRIVATIGLVLFIQGIFEVFYGNDSLTFPTFLPSTSYEIFGAYVTLNQIIVTVIGLAATLGLYVFFRTARLGIAMRAVVDDPNLLDIAGTKPRTVRRWAWIIGSVFALMSGILLAQDVTLDPVVMTGLVAQAFAAAAIGAFSSLPLTYAGGLAIGVAASVLTKYVPSEGILASLPANLPFLVLFVILLVLPRRRLSTRMQSIPLPSPSWRAPLRVQLLFGAVVLAGLLLVPRFAGVNIGQWTAVSATTVLFLSLGLLVKTSGQVSLATAGFAAIGAAAFSKLTVTAGVPWLLALLIAGLIAVPVGAVIATPAIRLSGLYLALATFGFGTLLADMFYNTSWMFGASGQGATMPAPYLSWLAVGSDTGYYYVTLAITVVLTIAVLLILNGRLGRLLRALGDSPRALSMGGTSVITTQILVFCVCAFLAAIAGALFGVSINVVDGTSFTPTQSLLYLALVLLAVGGAPWYALVQAMFVILIPAYVQGTNVDYYLQILFGVFAISLAFQPAERHAPQWFVDYCEALGRLLGSKRKREVRPSDEEMGVIRTPVPAQSAGLQVRGLRVQFGGLVALDGLALQAPAGKITGLIGPNGAGKTTAFDAICGLNSPGSGQVELHGRSITGSSPPTRARFGLGRTFQQMQLYDSLTVLENVSLGREAACAGWNPLRHLFSVGREKTQTRAAAWAAMQACEITHLAQNSVGGLSTGQRRLVEFARCLAGPFTMLLLDEPSSGLDGNETRMFGEVLRNAVRDRGVGVLLVEHDMSLVMSVCERVYVLDFGKLVFEGSPSEVAASPLVRAAYLGSAVGGLAPVGERVGVPLGGEPK